jgi:hypothetical protein
MPYLKEFEKLPIYREYFEFFKTHDTYLLQYILSFLNFGKKAYYKDPQLDATALREWKKVENRLENLTLPPSVHNIARVVEWLFSQGWDDSDFMPKHGPGAVAERGVRGVVQKNDSLHQDVLLHYLFFRSYAGCRERDLGFVQPSPEFDKISNDVRTSVLLFVPKDRNKTRSICKEPVRLQYAQQGVLLWFEEWLPRSPLYRHVRLDDQRVNQQAAQFGSKTGLLDTIDLSSASDSVSWELVKQLFPAKILKYLAGTRSSRIQLPNGETVEGHKFAPMGSALCFPVQTVIYSAVMIAVGICVRKGWDLDQPWDPDGDIGLWYTQSFHKSLEGDSRKPGRLLPFLAYGDDLITDSRMTDKTISTLFSLGFVVNEDKSFVGQQVYRESCGKHYFCGVDVTPYYYRVGQLDNEVSIETIASIVDQANRAREYHYASLRKVLIRCALTYPIKGVRKERSNGLNPILFSSDEDSSLAILCDKPRNTHLRRRKWDYRIQGNLNGLLTGTEQNLQRTEYLHIGVEPHTMVAVPLKHDGYFYTTWFRAARARRENIPVSWVGGHRDANGVKPRWIWSPSR